MAAAAVAAIGGSVISGAFNLGQQAMQDSSNQDIASMQNETVRRGQDFAVQMQDTQNKFDLGMVNKQIDAFTKAGLPSFMAYGGSNQSTGIQQSFHLGGRNYMDGGMLGQTSFGNSIYSQRVGSMHPMEFSGLYNSDNNPNINKGGGRTPAKPTTSFNSAGTNTESLKDSSLSFQTSFNQESPSEEIARLNENLRSSLMSNPNRGFQTIPKVNSVGSSEYPQPSFNQGGFTVRNPTTAPVSNGIGSIDKYTWRM